MATPPDSPMDEALSSSSHPGVPKHRPVALEDLCRQTKFTRQEIRVMYRGFKQNAMECILQYLRNLFTNVCRRLFSVDSYCSNLTSHLHYRILTN
ncbi:hypothetical protein L9F63_026650, partial [Diploptera punctata]